MRLLPHIYTPNGPRQPSHAHTAHAAAACSHTRPHGSGGHRAASHKARSCTHWRAHGIPQAAVLTLSRSYQVMPAIAQCIAAGACRRRTTMRSSSGATHGRSTCASRHCAEAASRAFSLAHALSTPFCAAAAKRNSFGANGQFQPLSSALTARAVRLAVHAGSSAWRAPVGSEFTFGWLVIGRRCGARSRTRCSLRPWRSMLTAVLFGRPTHRRAPCCAVLFCGEGPYMAAIAGLSRRSWFGPNC